MVKFLTKETYQFSFFWDYGDWDYYFDTTPAYASASSRKNFRFLN